MVRHDDEEIVGAKRGKRSTDNRVHLRVQVLDDGAVLRVDHGIVGWMLRIHGAPHHVRHLIDVAEVIEQEAVGEPIQDVAVLSFGFIGGDPRLLEEFRCRQHSRLEALGVLGHALRVEPPGGARQVRRIRARRRHRQRRRQRIEVQRADVQGEVGCDLLQVEPALSLDLSPRELELHGHPVAPLAYTQQPLLGSQSRSSRRSARHRCARQSRP